MNDNSEQLRDVYGRLKAQGYETERKERGVSCCLTDKDADSLRDDQDHEKQSLLDWLSPLNFWLKHDNVRSKRCEGTGNWLLHTKHFEDWAAGSTRTLLCLGMRMRASSQLINTSMLIAGSWCWQDSHYVCISTVQRKHKLWNGCQRIAPLLMQLS